MLARVPLWFLLGLLSGPTHSIFDPVHHIESARVYGNIDAYAYYFVDLLVGTPPQRVSVIVDTGSGVCAFPCANCGHCGHHMDPAFDFARSSTARWTPCGAGCGSRCTGGKCSYSQGYTEGSSISGFWFKDKVRLGDSLQQNPAVMSRMGCHNNENNLFYTQKANGILGIGPNGRGGGRTLMQELFQDREHVEGSIFALCFAEWGGRLVVGGFNESYHRGPVQYTPMILRTGYYGVGLTAMRVGSRLINEHFGSAMIDSGTTYSYMGTKVYRALKDGIMDYCRGHEGCGAVNKNTCWDLPQGYAGLALFPVVEVLFGSVTSAWVPKAYLYRKGNTSTWCFAFEDDGANANTVLGASWMLHKEIIFDMRSNRVGIAQADCPEFRERPLPPSARTDPAPMLPSSTSTTALTRTKTTTSTAVATSTSTTTSSSTTVQFSLPAATSPVFMTSPTTWSPASSTPTTASTPSTVPPYFAPTGLEAGSKEDSAAPPAWGAPTPAASSTTTSAGPGNAALDLAAAVGTKAPPAFSTTSVEESQRPAHGHGSRGAGHGHGSRGADSEHESRGADSGRKTASTLEDAADWLLDDPMRFVFVLAGAVFAVASCTSCVCHFCCRPVIQINRHVKLKELDESGMPPQVVGSAMAGEDLLRPGPDAFVIGEDEEDIIEHLSEEAAAFAPPVNLFLPEDASFGAVAAAFGDGDPFRGEDFADAEFCSAAEHAGSSSRLPIFTGGALGVPPWEPPEPPPDEEDLANFNPMA